MRAVWLERSTRPVRSLVVTNGESDGAAQASTAKLSVATTEKLGGLGASARTLATGVLLLWLNPKAWAMTLGAAAAFAGPGTGLAELLDSTSQ